MRKKLVFMLAAAILLGASGAEAGESKSKRVPAETRSNGVTDLFFRQNKVIGGGGVYAPPGTARLVANRMAWNVAGTPLPVATFVDLHLARRVLMTGNVVLSIGAVPDPLVPLVALAPVVTSATPFSEVDGLYDNVLSSSDTFLQFQPETNAPDFALVRNRVLGGGVFAREVGLLVGLGFQGADNWWGAPAGPGGVGTPVIDPLQFLAVGISPVTPAQDRDRDGLTIEEERHYGTTEAVDRAGVQASKDTDGDGVPDGIEVAIGTNPLLAESFFGTNLVDTDLDGLPLTIPVAGLMSMIDPDGSRRDVDGDGVMDAYELVVGTSMQDNSDAVRMGDVNGDGSVLKVAASRKETGTKGALIDSADNVMLLKFFLRTPSDSAAFAGLVPELSDLNRDGVVDNADAYRLQLFILGSVSVLPTR